MMIDISSTVIKKLVVHKVGNKLRDEGFILSSNETQHKESLDNQLLKHYLVPIIRQGDSYNFYHESDITLNVMYHYIDLIFSNNSSFLQHSQDIAKQLYSSSTHPNIGGGEFIVILFDDLRINEEKHQALGFFKIENKSNYLDIKDNNGSLAVVEKTGISLDKIQKGAVIISGEKKVHVIDAIGQKTKYWLDTFLKVIPSQTSKTCTKAIEKFITSIANYVEDPNDSLKFSKEVTDSLLEEKLSFKKIKDISAHYIDEQQINGILAGVNEKTGFDLDDDIIIETKRLEKLSKNIIKKTHITKDITLLISSNKTNIASMDVQKTKNGIRAIIDIHQEGE